MQEIRLTALGAQLQGIGRLPDGRVVFVPGALPDETADIEITKATPRYCEARLCRVIEPSPDRVAPDCPYAGACGGCAGRHMRYQATLAAKQRGVSDALARIGGVARPTVRPILGCAEPNRRRNKVEFAIASENGVPAIGFMAAGSRRVIPVKSCMQAHPAIGAALEWMNGNLGLLENAEHFRNLVCRANRSGELMLVFCADAPAQGSVEKLVPTLRKALPGLVSVWFVRQRPRPAQALDGKCVRVWGADVLYETLSGLRFGISPQSFFQVDTAQAERLYAAAVEAMGDGGNVLDAYCGTGTITLCAARRANAVTGIEIVAPAVEDAKRNARANGLDGRTRFICADVAEKLPALVARGERFDTVLLDPPRKGVDAKALDAIVRAKPARIVYVSCDPATLARDVKALALGGYRMAYAQPVDMFAYTGHVETVVLMSRKDT